MAGKNVLTDEQKAPFWEAVKRDAKAGVLERHTLEELAVRYSKELGYPITHANITKAVNVFGLKTKLTAARHNSPNGISKRLDRIEHVLRLVCDMLDVGFDTIASGTKESSTGEE